MKSFVGNTENFCFRIACEIVFWFSLLLFNRLKTISSNKLSMPFLKYMGELGYHFEVYRNDELTVEELKR